MKKAELAFSQIVIAILALVVLVVIIVIFSGNVSDTNKDFKSCALHGGRCVSQSECPNDGKHTIYRDRSDICDYSDVCCISVLLEDDYR